MKTVVMTDGVTKLTLIEDGYLIRRTHTDIFTEETYNDDIVTSTLANEIHNGMIQGFRVIKK